MLEAELSEFRGVVTAHSIPAKVLKINEIIKNPDPGTSIIGEEGLLVEMDQNPDVMANWTVVAIKYYQYEKPKVIRYEVLSEQQEITVNYHAVSVEIVGDLSAYMDDPKAAER